MASMHVVLNVGLVLLTLANVHGVSPYTVHSPWGSIQGVPQSAPTGRRYVSYLNIPYAMPPVGNLRFRHPVRYPRYKGIFRTPAQFGSICPQTPISKGVSKSRIPPQSEDCLTLNVFTPRTASKAPRAVMVWIHGGGWEGGAAFLYNMWKLVTESDVIGVSIQYRLGALGFLSTGSKVLPGNYAMMDQVLALKWVKNNIASFGGDVNNITIFGESAGGGSVGFLTMSPLSTGLFNRAIMQSGSALDYWATRTDAKKYAMELARRLNCSTPSTSLVMSDPDLQMVTCLRKASFRQIIDSSDFDLPATVFMTDLVWSPVVDQHFLVDDPQKLIQDTAFLQSIGFYDIDVMLGVNNAEGGYTVYMAKHYGKLHKKSGIDIISSHDFYVNEFLPTMLARVYGTSNKVDVDLLAFEALDYEVDQSPYLTLNQTAVALLGQATDIVFLVPAVRTARAHAARPGTGRTYLYYFDHYPSYAKEGIVTGMDHGTDIGYTFGLSETYIHSRYPTGKINPLEYNISDTFAQMLATFAKTGNPNAALRSKLSSTWPDFSDNESYLSFSNNLAVKDHIRRKDVALWVDLIPKLNEDLRHSGNVSYINSIPVIG